MNKSIDQTRAILIGGSSHTGKSTLGRAVAAKLGWSYYDRQMRAEIDRLGLMCVDVESISTADELLQCIFN